MCCCISVQRWLLIAHGNEGVEMPLQLLNLMLVDLQYRLQLADSRWDALAMVIDRADGLFRASQERLIASLAVAVRSSSWIASSIRASSASTCSL